MRFSPAPRMCHLSALVVFFAILSCSTAAFAAHPLITDDTGPWARARANSK